MCECFTTKGPNKQKKMEFPSADETRSQFIERQKVLQRRLDSQFKAAIVGMLHSADDKIRCIADCHVTKTSLANVRDELQKLGYHVITLRGEEQFNYMWIELSEEDAGVTMWFTEHKRDDYDYGLFETK
jgi:hypothetical protein